MKDPFVMAKDILSILERTVGAPSDNASFLFHVDRAITDKECLEYRFCGNLGFGGKLWLNPNKPPYVTCYKEDETPGRRELIELANQDLKDLFHEE